MWQIYGQSKIIIIKKQSVALAQGSELGYEGEMRSWGKTNDEERSLQSKLLNEMHGKNERGTAHLDSICASLMASSVLFPDLGG